MFFIDPRSIVLTAYFKYLCFEIFFVGVFHPANKGLRAVHAVERFAPSPPFLIHRNQYINVGNQGVFRTIHNAANDVFLLLSFYDETLSYKVALFLQTVRETPADNGVMGAVERDGCALHKAKLGKDLEELRIHLTNFRFIVFFVVRNLVGGIAKASDSLDSRHLRFDGGLIPH